MAIDLDELSQALAALKSGNLNSIRDKLQDALDDLADKIDGAEGEDLIELQKAQDLTNRWLDALNAATGPDASGETTQALLTAMQNASSAGSTALDGSLLKAVHGAVAAFAG